MARHDIIARKFADGGDLSRAKRTLLDPADPQPQANIPGTPGDDNLVDTTGNDTIDAMGGNDTITVSDGTDTVNGGTDLDRLVINYSGGTGIGNSVVLSGSLATGYSGTIGGSGRSVAFQGIENFTINTSNNDADSIVTGDGEDEFSQIALDSPNYIRDTVNLGGGIDRLSVDARGTNGALSFLFLNYDGSGEAALYGNGKLGFTNVERFFFQGGNAADNVRGLDFDDRFDGNAGNDRLAGRGGDDDLRGGAGADVVDGDGRVMILLAVDNQNNAGTGTSDNDFRVTGLYTAANPAEFDLAAGMGNGGNVRLRIRANDAETAGGGYEVRVNGTLVGTLAATANGATGDTIITFDSALLASGNARVSIQNSGTADADGFRIDDVELTIEKTGADRLDGGGGVDQLVGGRGDDTYVVDQERDQAQEQAGQGADTVLSQSLSYTLGANIENAATALVATPAVTAETQINTDIVSATQHPRSVTVLNDGGYVVTWQDVNNGNDVRARVFNVDGTARSAEFTVHASTAGNQGQFGMGAVALANGGFLIAYYETTGGANDERISGRLFDANGVPQGASYILTDTAGTFDSFPAMARLNNGQIALFSQNGGAQDGSGTFGIRYQLLNADGSVSASPPVVFQTTIGGDQVGPAVAKLDDGRLIVVWESGEPGGKVFRGRFVEADGTLAGSDFVLSTPGGESPDSGEVRAQVTAINGGGFAVVWGITNEIVGRVFNSSGTAVAPQFTINQRTDGAQTTVAITRLAEGGFMAAWTSDNGQDGDAHGVIARLFNPDGSARSDDFVVNQVGTRFQLFPELATLQDGRVVVVFSSDVPGSGGNYEAKQVILDTTPPQTLVGNELTNTLTGSDYDDFLVGSGGGDTLIGGGGNDTLYGGEASGPDMAVGAFGPNLIVNGSFEQRDATTTSRDYTLANANSDFNGGEPLYALSNQLLGWGLLPGNTRVEFNTDNPNDPRQEFQTGDGLVALDLEVFPGEQSGIFQDVAGLGAGQRYRITVSVAVPVGPGNGTAAVQILWNGIVVGTVTPTSTTPTDYSFDVYALAVGAGVGGANRIAFQEVGGNDGQGRGVMLDNVRLNLLAADGADDDLLQGGDGNDTLYGGVGTDLLQGGDGADQLNGGASNDTLEGGAGADTLNGDAGNDILRGGDDADTLNGGDDDDILEGGAGVDALNGGAGNDMLDGGTGADSLAGGAGNDVYFLDVAGDTVLENAGEGSADEIRTSLTSYQLPTEVEILTYTGTTASTTLRGNAAANTITGGAQSDFIDLRDGGNDTASGGGGNDGFYFGGAYSIADVVDGGAGNLDQVGLQGDYSAGVTLGSLNGIELVVLLSGSDTRFGDPGTNFYDYNITSSDASVAAGQRLIIQSNTLRIGEDLTFNGSAETDGSFLIYGGGGVDNLTGGAGDDGFFFGEGRFGASDVVNGGGGNMDQLGLQGNFSVTFGAGQMSGIEFIVLLSASDNRFGSSGGTVGYNLTMNDANVAAGQTMAVSGTTLRSGENLSFNGSAETNGRFEVYSGDGNDVITGGAGNDLIFGGGRGDTLTGGGGNDVFAYRALTDSNSTERDGIQDFNLGDRIDLSRIDANPNLTGMQSFNFVGTSAFTGTAGELRYENISLGGPIYLIQGDANGDGVSDLEIVLVISDGHTLTVNDFIGVNAPPSQEAVAMNNQPTGRAPVLALDAAEPEMLKLDGHRDTHLDPGLSRDFAGPAVSSLIGSDAGDAADYLGPSIDHLVVLNSTHDMSL